jgi:hypothetical protein
LFEINDKVRIIKQRKTKNYENTYGKEGFVVYIDYQTNKYGVEFSDIKNPASSYGRYYFEEGELELVESKILALDDITARSLTCVIHTPNREDAICVVGKIPSLSSCTTSDEWLEYWDRYKENTCYNIVDGRIDAYGSKAYFEASIKQGSNYLIYEFSDLFATGGVVPYLDLSIFKEKNKEEKKMFTFTITKGIRERKSYEKDKPKTIETISTTVRTECGQATTTCDKSDFYDIYTGALVAAAKITTKQSEEAMLLYKTAIDMWGNEMCFSILKALANRAFGNEKFDWAYKKWRKAVAYEERQKDIKARTCSVCGKVFKTIEEARAHEKWHEDCRTRKIERREAKRRLAEAEREGRISDIMTELLEERKKNDEKKNEE